MSDQGLDTDVIRQVTTKRIRSDNELGDVKRKATNGEQ